MMSRNLPSVEDVLWFEGLPIELQARVERLFQDRRHLSSLLNDAFSRGYRAGFNAQLPDDLKLRITK